MLERGERIRRPDQQQVRLGMRIEEVPAGGQGDAGAVVTPHAIDSQGGRHGLNCRGKERSLKVGAGKRKSPACGPQPGLVT